MPKLHTRLTALGSPCEFQLYGASKDQLDEVAAACASELGRIETKYSRYLDDSIVTRINQSAGTGTFTRLDDETKNLFAYAQTAFEQSDCLFDITSGVLRRAWDFKSGRLPNTDELRDLCKLVGWKRVEMRGEEIHLPRLGMEIDFGGFGKEYAADRLAGVCHQHGITSGLIDLGGDVCIVGPHPDGSPWLVGIRDPRDPERAMASLPLSHGSLATSGDYERFMEIDGKRYCHLLNPRTGWPITGMAGVSVVADQCLVAGTATTIAMLKGHSGARWLEKLGLPYLWVDENRRTGGSLWPKRTPRNQSPATQAS